MLKKYDYLIYNAINGAEAKRHTSFHMPGHKGDAAFKKRFKGAETDITELSFSDNLHSPAGIIKRAQEDIAEIVGAYASYITTDGSTSGVYTLIYAAAKRGGKIIVPRNSHRSVYSACRLFNIEPVIVQGKEREGLLLPPDPETVERIFAADGGVSAIIVTSPDYYGNIAPLEKYAEITKKYSRLLLVDGAHGAHLAFEEGRAGYAGAYADMWVDGAHKTLPTLTQGAALHVSSEKFSADAEDGMALFRTTSPSYPIMASVEYGYKYLANNPEVIQRGKTAAAAIKSGLAGFTFYPSDDWCKIAVDFKPLGISPERAAEYLEKNNIYAELTDGRYMLLYLSPTLTDGDAKKLCAAMQKIKDSAALAGSYRGTHAPIPAADRTYSYLYALAQPWEYVPLELAVGRMSAENTGINPPCIPVVVAGEIYTASTVNILKRNGSATFGVVRGKVKVVKN